jgi:hypothetical protein
MVVYASSVGSINLRVVIQATTLGKKMRPIPKIQKAKRLQ